MYLCKRIRTHNETHSHFTRNRLNIDPPFARTKLRNNSYFIYISKKFNELSKTININNISIHTFRERCHKYLLDNQ